MKRLNTVKWNGNANVHDDTGHDDTGHDDTGHDDTGHGV